MIITFDLFEWWTPSRYWPGAGLHPQICRAARHRSNWRWMVRAEWSESACGASGTLRPLVADRGRRQVVMCLWADIGSAGSGSGRASGCGWSAGRTPSSYGQSVLRSHRSWWGCRGPQRTDCYSCQPHAQDCWCCCCSRWMTQSPRHPGLAQGREDELCSAVWLEAPGGHSPHHHSCAAVSCFQSTYDDTESISDEFPLCFVVTRPTRWS